MKKNLLIFLTLISGVAQGQLADFGKIDFHKADSIANYYEGETLVNLPILSHKLTVDLATEAEKFRAIYTWVCKNIENDHGAYLKNKVKRTKLQGDDRALEEWNSAFTAKVFRTLLKEPRKCDLSRKHFASRQTRQSSLRLAEQQKHQAPLFLDRVD